MDGVVLNGLARIFGSYTLGAYISARIIDQNIDLAEFFPDVGNVARHHGFISEVSMDCQYFRPMRLRYLVSDGCE